VSTIYVLWWETEDDWDFISAHTTYESAEEAKGHASRYCEYYITPLPLKDVK